MRLSVLTAVFACVLITAAGGARAQSALPDLHPATVTADLKGARATDYTCRRAWRCGPYDCGWRQICARAGWRADWQSHHYYWRRHQWRRHYW